MSIQGNLESISIVELFSSLLQWGKTGVLSILTEIDERGFLFYKGNVVYATDRGSARRLGNFLVRLGFLTDGELNDSLRLSTSSQGHLGQRLLEAGRISEWQLKTAVKAQVLDIFLEVLTWEQGAFIFDDTPLPFDVAEGILISTQTLLFEAVTMADECAHARSLRVGQLDWHGHADHHDDRDAPGAGEAGDQRDSGSYPEERRVFKRRLAGLVREVRSAGPAVPEILRNTVAPDVPSKIFAIGEGEGSSETRVGEVVAREPMLAAKVLKALMLSNVQLAREELTVERLLDRVGAFNGRCLLLPEAVRALWFPRNKGYWRECWEHDQICAHLCALIAEKMGYPYPGEAYLAGLIHNLGVYILMTNYPEEYRRTVTNSIVAQLDVELLEKETFGTTHTRVGGLYARRWSFPPSLQMAIKDHHRVDRKLTRPLLSMLYVSNHTAYEYGYRIGFERVDEVVLRTALEELSLAESELISLFIEARHKAGSAVVTEEYLPA